MGAVLAIIGSIAVVLGFVTAVLGLLNQRAAQRAMRQAADTAGKVQQISVNVDGRLSKLMDRQAQLLATLHEHQVAVPPPPPAPNEPDNRSQTGSA